MRIGVLALVLTCACGFRGAAASDATGGAELGAVEAGIDGQVPADWWDPHWHHRRRVHVDTSGLTSTLSGFPVLVTLDAGFAFAHANPTGNDLRFVADDGTVLASDLDSYAAPAAAIWVRVPAIEPPPMAAPAFWLYYGNAAPATTLDPTAVWVDDLSVHHMTSGADATGLGHTAAPVGTQTMPTAMAGRIGAGQRFDGSANAMTLAHSVTTMDLATSLTVSFWMRSPGFTVGFQAMVLKGDHAWRVQGANGTDQHRSDFATSRQSDGSNDNLVGVAVLDDNAWHHVAVSFANTTKATYVDGVLDQTGSFADTIQTSTAAVVFGENDEASATRNFAGDLDEIRITAMPRTRDWITAEHRSVSQVDFVTLDAETSI